MDLFGRFARSRKGVAAIEFGMVAIPFLALLCAIFETAFVFFVHESFDAAVETVAREVATNQYYQYSSSNGAAATTTPTATTFLNVVPVPQSGASNGASLCNSLPSFIDCSKVVLNVQNYCTTASASCTSPTNWSNVTINESWYTTNNTSTNTVNLGNPGDIVVFQAFYPMPVYLSVLTANGTASNSVLAYGSGFVHAIFSTFVFRNEP